MLGSRTDLHIFDAGSINGTRYCNEILLPYVRLLRGAMSLQFLFMDDNAPYHRTIAAEQLLEREDIEHAISNKIPLKIKMDRLKFKLEIVEALSATSPTNRSTLTNEEDNSVVIPLAKRSKRYNPPAIHVMVFILAIPG
ncbi:uncharacterized protein TNCV_2557031 [Trichonephila clavipes]|nr:uncharacterized protein TNCV_2557031 [Trichonephila clavipes]